MKSISRQSEVKSIISGSFGLTVLRFLVGGAFGSAAAEAGLVVPADGIRWAVWALARDVEVEVEVDVMRADEAGAMISGRLLNGWGNVRVEDGVGLSTVRIRS